MRHATALPAAALAVALTSVVRADPTPLARAVTAAPQGPALVPVLLAEDDDPVRGVKARVDGAERVVRLVRIESVAPTACARVTWLPVAPSVSVHPAEVAADSPGAGVWMAVIEDPGVTAVRLGDATVTVKRLEDPVAAARRAGLPSDARTLPDDPLENPWASPVPEAWRRDPALLEELARLSVHHETAWRVLLALGGLGPTDRDDPAALDIADAATPTPADRPGDTERRALRDAVVVRWQHAMLRLWLADPEASVLARRALAGAARLPDTAESTAGTRVVPVWTAGDTEAAELLAAIDAASSGPDLAAFTRAWARPATQAAAWIIDDAAPTAGVVNLADAATIASWAGEAGWALRNDAIRLDARSGLSVRGGPADAEAPGPVGGSRFDAGDWSARRAVLAGVIEAIPPGPLLGPLHDDFSMASWLAAATPERPATIPSAARTIARLERREVPTPAGGLTGEPVWTVVLECVLDPTHAVPAPDRVDLWLGPRGSPRSVVRVERDGTISALRGLPPTRAWTPVPEEQGRWVAVVPLPDGAIDAAGRVLIGLVREEACGRRSAWPRPMLPWQQEPGRVLIDTAAWGVIDAALSR